ncbi:hypothetical protein LI291_07060 [Intestinibacillus massiliensis]|nr:hypothetical protein [Intestinibacillus massiliensis]
MEILLYLFSAVALVVTGAVVSGGLALPQARRARGEARETPPEDELGRDLAALLGYQAGGARREMGDED